MDTLCLEMDTLFTFGLELSCCLDMAWELTFHALFGPLVLIHVALTRPPRHAMTQTVEPQPLRSSCIGA